MYLFTFECFIFNLNYYLYVLYCTQKYKNKKKNTIGGLAKFLLVFPTHIKHCAITVNENIVVGLLECYAIFISGCLML